MKLLLARVKSAYSLDEWSRTFWGHHILKFDGYHNLSLPLATVVAASQHNINPIIAVISQSLELVAFP